MIDTLTIQTGRQGLFEFTLQLEALVSRAGIQQGICNLLIKHTSASLIIQENADISARIDLENWFNRLVPERDSIYTHTFEGDDDMPSHIKSALTATTPAIPVDNGQLALGVWQGVYVWEHRHSVNSRQVVVYLGE